MPDKKTNTGIWQRKIIIQAIKGSFLKLDPFTLFKNPVMFVVELGSMLTTLIFFHDLYSGKSFSLDLQLTLWFWFTVLFANFAEALAEGKGKAQADSLRKTKSETSAVRLLENGGTEKISALLLKKGDLVIINEGEIIPCDGEIQEGVALVDESAITGESAPVVREGGGDKNAVTGGTRLLSGKLKIHITVEPGETFIDQMIKMVEGAKRQKTPNERALEVLLIAMTVLFLTVVITLNYFSAYMGVRISIPVLVALLVCLMPTTIGGLLPAIGIAGMERLLDHNVIAMSGRAVEAAGDVNVVLLDKTGTITLGNRMATEFIAAAGIKEEELARAAIFASLSDETPEGRSIVTLAKERLQVKGSEIKVPNPNDTRFIKFNVETQMSGLDMDNGTVKIRKGSTDAIEKFVKNEGGSFPDDIEEKSNQISREGGTPLVVASGPAVLGVVRLKDVLKSGIHARLQQLSGMGIESIMITGDNHLTAVVIAAEAGVSDFIARAKPETKLKAIRTLQAKGNMVAMIGDGTNDAPALAQADVAVAMNAGTQSAREAANMIDLDSNPTKLLDIVEIGKQILITRGSITTFSVTNDVSKYFAIIPAIFVLQYPLLNVLNIMKLHSPESAILSAVIFNAVIIPLLIPLALRGIQYKQQTLSSLFVRNLLIYGLGGLLLPFIGIKLIDIIVVMLKLV